TPNSLTPFSGLSVLTHSRNARLSPTHCTNGHQFRNRPMANMRIVLFITFLKNALLPLSCRRGITNAMAFPTAKRKNGNTRSVGVHPCQGACFKGANMWLHDPGL